MKEYQANIKAQERKQLKQCDPQLAKTKMKESNFLKAQLYFLLTYFDILYIEYRWKQIETSWEGQHMVLFLTHNQRKCAAVMRLSSSNFLVYLLTSIYWGPNNTENIWLSRAKLVTKEIYIRHTPQHAPSPNCACHHIWIVGN